MTEKSWKYDPTAEENFKTTGKWKEKHFFSFNSFIYDPVFWIFNTPAMSFELAAQGVMSERRTERAGVWLHVHSINKSFGLSQGNHQSHSKAPELSWFTPGKIQPWGLTHMFIQSHFPLLSLWGDQLGMFISWKQCPQGSFQHTSIHDMFNMWSIQWGSRGIFLNLMDSKLSWEHSILHYKTLYFAA